MDENTAAQSQRDASQSDTAVSQSSSLPLLIAVSTIEVTAWSSLPIPEMYSLLNLNIPLLVWDYVLGGVGRKEQDAHVWVIGTEAGRAAAQARNSFKLSKVSHG